MTGWARRGARRALAQGWRSAGCGDRTGFTGTRAAFSGRMTSKILFAVLLSANLASPARADDRPADNIDAAVAAEHEASTREHYNAQLTTIAERDIVTAQIIRDMAIKQWNAAVRDSRTGDVDQWAKRHLQAVRDENEARERATLYAQRRDQARADFEASAEKVRKLSARASK